MELMNMRHYFWDHIHVCDPKRCKECENKERNCCLQNPNFDVTYDPNRKHRRDPEKKCLMDVQWQNPNDKVVESQGYLLSEGSHTFVVALEDESYPYATDVEWALVFHETNCRYNVRRRLQQNGTATTVSGGNGGSSGNGGVSGSLCDDASTDARRVGLEIDVTSGTLSSANGQDIGKRTVTFTVSRLNCKAAAEAVGEEDPNNEKCFDNTAIYGNLVITKATSREQPDCYDGRIYPMRIPVWYNYGAAYVVPFGREEEGSAWLWWFIAILVLVLLLLAFLLYKYWFSNRSTGSALRRKQAELDQARMENEVGFGADLDPNAVGYNPIATGFNPNQPAANAPPNAPPDYVMGGAQFINPTIERPVFRQDYGPQHGKYN